MTNDIYNGNHPALWNFEQEQAYMNAVKEMDNEQYVAIVLELRALNMCDGQNFIQEFAYHNPIKHDAIMEATGLRYVTA
jgi:hypothetical protein